VVVQEVVVLALLLLTLVDLVVEEVQVLAHQVLRVIHLLQILLKVIMVEMVREHLDTLEVVVEELLLTEVIQDQMNTVLMEEMEVLEHQIQF
tara:strand:- start:219 stop:494 length:276 start_codon:yes stop_codon:yes gene_type:complete